MTSSNSENLKVLEKARNNFWSDFSVLKNKKDALLKLFRSKLESKKIEEIKRTLNNVKQP